MTPEAYVDTYKTYKEGTKRITTWLVTTAKRCGSADLDCLDSARKGFAEEEFKMAPIQAAKREVPPTRFVGLAQAIKASTDPKINLPSRIAALIKYVIELRKEANDFFAKFGKASLKVEGEDRDFISVHEEVLAVLQPASDGDVSIVCNGV